MWLEFVPRMNTEVTPPGPPVCTTFSPGTSLSTSAKVRSWRASMSSAVTTVMLLATSSTGVGMRVALMTIVCSSGYRRACAVARERREQTGKLGTSARPRRRRRAAGAR